MNQQWLPGDLRDRIRDLVKSKKITQAELANEIGINKSTLSRFMSGKTDTLSNRSVEKIARYFKVSSDFVLGLTQSKDRKNYDIGELGLTVNAAKNLYTQIANREIVSALLENETFNRLTYHLALYRDGLMSNGVAAENQLYSKVSDLLIQQGKNNPAELPASIQSAMTVKAIGQTTSDNEKTTMVQMFLRVMNDIKGSNTTVTQSDMATKEIVEDMIENMGLNQPGVDLRNEATPEKVVGLIMSSLMSVQYPPEYNDMVEEALNDLNKGLMQYWTVMNLIRTEENAG